MKILCSYLDFMKQNGIISVAATVILPAENLWKGLICELKLIAVFV